MKKVELKDHLILYGIGKVIPKGTQFEVVRYNSRYIYVKWNGCTLQLTRKDVNILK